METSTSKQFIPLLESIPYPSHPVMKWLFKTPLLLWRLGLGPLVGRLFMIMTTTGRKSGQPRHTAIEYHTWRGRKYVLAAWPKSDWYRNLQADPRLTIQTAVGAESVIARRLTDEAELADVYEFAAANPLMRRFWQLLGFDLNLESFLAHKEQFHLLTFEPTTEPTPPPLAADLVWVWPVVLVLGLLLRLDQRHLCQDGRQRRR